MRLFPVFALLALSGCVVDNQEYDPVYAACLRARSVEGPCAAYGVDAGEADLAPAADFAPLPPDLIAYYSPKHAVGEDCRFRLDCQQLISVNGEQSRVDCIDGVCSNVGPCLAEGSSCDSVLDCCQHDAPISCYPSENRCLRH